MTDELLFPTFTLRADDLIAYARRCEPWRLRAFGIRLAALGILVKPASERATLRRELDETMGSLDPKVREAVRDIQRWLEDRTIRRVEASTSDPERLDPCAWEMSSLGGHFPSQVVQAGEPVIEALRPAFEANRIVFVVDPYFASGSNEAARRSLFKLCADSGVKTVFVYTCWGWQHGLPKTKAEADENIEASRPTGKSPSVYACVSHKTDAHHDRYLAFSLPEAGRPTAAKRVPDPKLHAVALAAGIGSITEYDVPRMVALARISAASFHHAVKAYLTDPEPPLGPGVPQGTPPASSSHHATAVPEETA